MSNSKRQVPHVIKWILKILLGVISLFVLIVLFIAVFYVVSNHTNGTLLSSGVQRQYLLYVPKSYDPDTPSPLIVSLHGFASWPQNQMYISRWNDLADQHGFIMVYPSGTQYPKRWRLPVSTSEIPTSDEDVKFIADLIDHLQNNYNIDGRRIFVNGLSNGAGMSVAVGCELSERVAAIGGVAGAYLYPLSSCQATRPIPMIVFHGTEDPIVPFNGGSSSSFHAPFPDIPEWVNQHAALNGCNETPIVILDEETVSGIEYGNCRKNSTVIFYTIFGGGHTWPGGNPLPKWIAGDTSQAISASQLMWEFFELHPLPIP